MLSSILLVIVFLSVAGAVGLEVWSLGGEYVKRYCASAWRWLDGLKRQSLLALAIALAALVFFALAVFFSRSAHAQQHVCAPSMEAVTEVLLEKYSESPIATFAYPDGAVVVVFGSPDGTTWTSVLRRPGEDVACLMGNGFVWFFGVAPPVGDPV